MTKLKLKDLRNGDYVYIVPLDNFGHKLPFLAEWGRVDLSRNRIYTSRTSFNIRNMGFVYGYYAYSNEGHGVEIISPELLKQGGIFWAIRNDLDPQNHAHQEWGYWYTYKNEHMECCSNCNDIPIGEIIKYRFYKIPPKPTTN